MAPVAVGGCEAFRAIVSEFDWDVRTAMAVMESESGCIPDRDNSGLNRDGSNDVGLMQVNSIHVSSGLITNEARKIPSENIRAAYAIYQGALKARGNGWTAWSAYNNGSYIKYLR